MSVLIFGILNIGYGLLKLAMLAFAMLMSNVKMPGNPAMAAMKTDPTMIAYNKFAMPLGLVLALALIAFGIGLLLSKNWGRLGSVIWAVLEIVVTVVGTLVVWPITQRMMEQMPNMPHGMVEGFATIGMVIGLIIGLTYPALVLFFMTRDNVIDACQPELPPAPAQEPV